jgi:hypothetical protein
LGLNLEQKQAVVAEVAKQVAGAQAIVMAENRGMPVAAMIVLRAKARASGVYFRVVKNTLVRRAVADSPFARWPADGRPAGVRHWPDPLPWRRSSTTSPRAATSSCSGRRDAAGDVRQGDRRAGLAALA